MVQLVSEGWKTAKCRPHNLSDSIGRPDAYFEKITEPKREEHLLFERFMYWWNGRHLGPKQPVEPERHFTFFKIWDAFEQSECPLCHLARKSHSLFLSSFWYESVNDVGLRNRLHRSIGFSPETTETSQAMGDDLGMSIVYYVAKDVQELHEKSFGLCLQHIQEVLDALPTPKLRRTLCQIEEAKFRSLRQELDTFIGKSDYRNREPLGPERDAWIRAAKKFHRLEPLSHQSRHP